MSGALNPPQSLAERAQLAFNATVVALKAMGSNPEFSSLSSILLSTCDELQRIVRESERAH